MPTFVSFASTSFVTVMMSQPTDVGVEHVEQLARRAQISSALRQRVDERVRGGHQRHRIAPVSAMRPANTETYAGVFGIEVRDDIADLLEREHRGDVELDALRSRAS